jgi:hypothetical protein
MTEPGSDERFAELADIGALGRGQRAQRWRSLLEEWRVRLMAPADDPGSDYPDPDQTPAGDPPEYDPTPPA